VNRARNILLLLIFLILFTARSFAYERIVVLYAAASPVLKALGVEDRIVGVTKTDHVFDNVISVGSHLRPNIELLKVLKPDLIVAGSKRAFPEEMSERLDTDVFYFDARTLEDILTHIERLGKMLNRQEQAEALIKTLKEKLDQIKPLRTRPSVIYEVSAMPLKVAGANNIITSIIEHAGGINLIDVKKRHVLLSPERVIELSPDFYIYQVGPMNKNPPEPVKRPYFVSLKSRIIKVDEYEFARPGINAFEAVVKLNRIFMEVNK